MEINKYFPVLPALRITILSAVRFCLTTVATLDYPIMWRSITFAHRGPDLTAFVLFLLWGRMTAGGILRKSGTH